MVVSGTEQRYQEYFRTPLQALQVEHGLSSIATGDGGRWHGFSADIPGILYRMDFLRGEKPAVRIAIDRSDREWNKWLLNKLFKRRDAIEADPLAPIGVGLC